MPQHQIATGPQLSAQAVNDLLLRGLIEVDQDIASEDDVDRFTDRIILVHQVQAAEGDL